MNCDEKKPIMINDSRSLLELLYVMPVISVIFDYFDISRANWYPARGQRQKFIHAFNIYSKYSTIKRKLEPLETFEEQIGVLPAISAALSFQSFININSQRIIVGIERRRIRVSNGDEWQISLCNYALDRIFWMLDDGTEEI